MLDDTNKKRKAGRPKKLSSKDVQRSFQVDPDLWDAADDLPVPRPDIIRQALMNAVSFYATDLPKLRWQREETRAQIQSLIAKETFLDARIKELEGEIVLIEATQQKHEEYREKAVTETLHLTKVFKKNMTHEHFDIIAGLSGIESAKIEVFLKDTRFRPSEEEVRTFIFG